MEKKICKICGKVIPEDSRAISYCSAKCRLDGRIINSKRNQEEKHCQRCGKKIPKGSKRLSYCSDECRYEEQKERQKALFSPRKCSVCGKEIPRDSLRKTFCSNTCAFASSDQKKEVRQRKMARQTKNLAMANQKAREKGLTYGQYMAMLYGSRMG